MSQESEIRGALERYTTAWLAGDFAAVFACYHDDLTLQYLGGNALTGTHPGKAASAAALQEVSRRTGRRLVAIEAIMAGPERGAVISREAMVLDGAPVELTRLLVYHVEDGRLRECWVYDQGQRQMDRLIGPS